MKRILLACLLAALLAPPGAAQAPPASVEESHLFQDIGRIMATLQEITGLKPLKPVASEIISRERVKQFLEDRIRDEVKPEELRAEELTLKKFGFVPPDFDLRKTTVDLLTEQAAAFYDYRKKRLYVLESPDEALQQMALVHELAHALADQHFNLDKYIQRGKDSDDGAMARLAVMEGQAMWIMAESMARQMNLSLKTSPALATYMGREMGAAAGQFPVFDKAPLYLQETLLFPYTRGILFQQAVIEKHGQEGFGLVFQKPPASTRHILHPDQYFAGEKPAQPPAPALATAGQYQVLAEGSIGELDHWILLRQYAGPEDADSLAPAWRGGRYRLHERKKDKRVVLAYASQWDSEESARRFFDKYRQVLRGKWNAMDVALEEANRLTGKGDDGYFVLRLSGNRVFSLEGLSLLNEAKAP